MKFLLLSLFFLLHNTVFAAHDIEFTNDEKEYLSTTPTVTIGSINSYTPFSFILHGHKVGFTQDLIDIIANKTGIKFEKVGGSWPEVYKKFSSGDIDMISEFSYRLERISFTNYTKPYYEIPIGVFTRKDFGVYKGLSSLKGKKVGIVKNSYLVEILQKSNDIELIQIDSTDERFYALAKGKVDIVLSNAMSLYRLDSLMLQNIELTGYFKHPETKNEDLRFGIKKDEVHLASIINKTLDSIPYSTIISLKDKWILKNKTNQNKIHFTQAEQKWIDNNKIILGIEQSKPYIYFDEKTQSVDGLYAAILNVVLDKTGLKEEYITGEWSELLENFKAKKIDLLPATFYKKSREKFGNFTTEFYKVREHIYINKTEKKIHKIHDLQNKKVAIVKNYATIDKIKNKFPLIKIVKTKNLEESIHLLQSNQVDAFIDYHLVVENFIQENFIVGLKSIAQNELEPFSVHYFSNINKPILKSILQKGLDSITREEKNKILKNWIHTPYIEPNSLSYKEKLFIEKHPIIRIRVRPNRPPFEFEQNGKVSGIAVDYVKKSAENIGLTVKFILDDTNIKDAYNTIETSQDKFDSLLFSVKNKEREERFSFGRAFLSYPMMIITNKKGRYINSLDDLKYHKVVLEKGFLTNKWIKKDYPEIKIINVAGTKKALELVNNDKNIAYVGNLAVANYMSLSGDLKNIKVVAPTPYGNINYSFIAPKHWPELTSLLDKGFHKISPIEHSTIQQKWFSLQTIEKTDYSLLWQTIIVSILIILGILWSNRKIALERNRTKKALDELQKAQYSLEEKTKEQLHQQQMMLNQSKIASMGEMIGNIAHQWRQPLSVISTASTGLLVEKKFHPIGDKKLEYTLTTINEQAQYLSNTIDTFSDYIKSNKKVKKVVLQDCIQIAINIIHASFKNNFIKLETNLNTTSKIEIDLIAGELSEVIINILNNAKDIIIQNKIKNPYVRINIKKHKKMVSICIEDNGGGIPENIISKIFEPYFTTKHQSQGTGLGLHMSYKIIKESFNGQLYVKNGLFGAQFFIELPLKEKN